MVGTHFLIFTFSAKESLIPLIFLLYHTLAINLEYGGNAAENPANLLAFSSHERTERQRPQSYSYMINSKRCLYFTFKIKCYLHNNLKYMYCKSSEKKRGPVVLIP